MNKSELRKVRPNPEEHISTFNRKNPELFGAIRQNMNILYADQQWIGFYKQIPLSRVKDNHKIWKDF